MCSTVYFLRYRVRGNQIDTPFLSIFCVWESRCLLFWRAQNRKKVIRHKSPSPQGGERGKRRRTREKPPPSPPHPFLTRKKVLGKKKIEKSQSSLSMLGFQRKKTFFFPPFRRISGSTTKKHIFRTEFPGLKGKKSRIGIFPSSNPSVSISRFRRQCQKRQYTLRNAYIGFSHKK